MSHLDELLRQLPAFKEWVPMHVRTWSFYAFILVFQLSGGIYLSALPDMEGETALMQEDLLMAGLSSFLGISMAFPLLFRLKFRLTSRFILQVTTAGLVACNLVTMHCRSVPLLVVTCFIAGMLRMWGTFECFSTIQLRITPTRNFAVFFPVVYATVFGCIQVSGYLTTWLAYHYHWQYMQLVIIALLLGVFGCTRLLLRPFHMGKPMPLYGIDWLGALLWSTGLGLLIFVANYGDYYDWFHSPLLCAALAAGIGCVALNIGRMHHIRHPYIDPQVYRYPKVVPIILLFAALCLLSSTATVLQGVFTGVILGYDSLTAARLNLPSLLGTLAGAAFTLYALTRLHLTYKQLTVLGFVCMLAYQVECYFLISPETALGQLYLPVFVRNFGNVILYIALTTYLQQLVPFVFFFQALGAVGFIREGIGSPIANALTARLFKVVQQSNAFTLSTSLDGLDVRSSSLPLPELFGELQRQSLLVSLKEVYGYAVLLGILFLLLVLAMRYRHIVRFVRMPPVEVFKRLLEIRHTGERGN